MGWGEVGEWGSLRGGNGTLWVEVEWGLLGLDSGAWGWYVRNELSGSGVRGPLGEDPKEYN